MNRRKFLSFLAAAPALPTLGTAAAQADYFYVEGCAVANVEDVSVYDDWKDALVYSDLHLPLRLDEEVLDALVRNITEPNLIYTRLVEDEGLQAITGVIEHDDTA